nr:hypothetical protein T03D3.7 - Caenorhabditis elegans [Caenorhabditis elegans]
MFEDWIYKYIPQASCALTFLVNPIFIYLIFSEKSSKFGNYRFLLLYFAIFNLLYSMLNVIVPLDIHNYRYSFFIFVRHGWFMERSELNFHALAARCSIVASSYAVLFSHFIYRYLVISDSSLTRHHFHWYMTGSFLLSFLYFSWWHATCYFPGRANIELLQYIREDFQETFGLDSMNFNMAGAMFSVGSDKTNLRAWELIANNAKAQGNDCENQPKTSRFQFELLRALIVQSVIPIFISFSPCTFCWYSAIFGIQLDKSFNYFESIALGVFSFVDPIAIILCLPIFRCKILNAINCFSKIYNKNSTSSITKF